jgi:glycosyltransferase involved in cell wall biosynthesis
LAGTDHHLEREWLSLKEYAWRVNRRLRRDKPDIVFSPSQLIPTYLRTTAKIIYCNDAPFGGIANYYRNFSRLSQAYLRQGYRQEWLAHRNAFRIVYPSAWAVNCAVRLHRADPDKCFEQAFGANLPYDPRWSDVKLAIERRASRKDISMLLISSDWERKGGPFAVTVVQELQRKRIDARLRVIGAAPEGTPNVEVLGRINKWAPPGARRFWTSLINSDFIIMPSHAEAYGMGLWEGAAHGLPMIGRATGGITSIIRNQETGLLFPSTAEARFVADWIENALTAHTYRHLSEAAFMDYRQRGNWKTFVDRVFDFE